MSFHKRHVNDDQVIQMYTDQGAQAVINWFTIGVDALVIGGKLSEQVEEIIYSNKLTQLETLDEVATIISIASVRKTNNEKKTKTTPSS